MSRDDPISLAENDARINQMYPTYEEALKKAGVPYEIHVYPGTQHAFNQDNRPDRYNKAAADLAAQVDDGAGQQAVPDLGQEDEAALVEFLLDLKEKGRAIAEKWLNTDYEQVGLKSTFDPEDHFYGKL